MDNENRMNDQPLVPIVLDVGKKRKKAVRELKRGRGKLIDEVEQTIAEVRAGLGVEAQNKEIVPVILIYRRKSKKRGWGF